MAEGWAKQLRDSDFDAWSAGIETHGLNELAVAAMAEAGVDISRHESTLVDDLVPVEFDLVVTVCDNARESCPIFPGRVRVIHHSFDDPPRLAAKAVDREEKLVHFRRVRDEIRTFVTSLTP